MGGTVAILAALPREIQGLVKGCRPEPTLREQGIWLYRTPGAVVVAAGMGAARVSAAFEAARAHAQVVEVISAGLAGACTAQFVAGEAVEVAVVVDPSTGERFRTARAGYGALLVSNVEIASVWEKARLAASYGAGLVDMEAATVGRLAAAHGLPFRAVKGISDAHDFELESLARFTGRRGQFRTVAFALHTAVRPASWGKAVTLGRNSARALAELWRVLAKDANPDLKS